MQTSKNAIFLLLLCTLFLFSCYEKKEGCLDVLAANFSIDADEDCCENPDACCCEYPPLTWSIKHQYADENISSGKTYLNRLGQPFQIDKISFFVSNIRLIDGLPHAISDSIAIQAQSGQTIVKPNDVAIVRSSSFSIKFDAFNRPGAYSLLQFTVGLSEPERSADRNQFESAHPLSASQTELRDTIDNQWLLYRVDWIPDTLSGEIQSLSIPVSTTEIEISLPIDLSKGPGEPISIPIGIDYARWFDEIDLVNDSDSTQNRKILKGLPDSFSIL